MRLKIWCDEKSGKILQNILRTKQGPKRQGLICKVDDPTSPEEHSRRSSCSHCRWGTCAAWFGPPAAEQVETGRSCRSRTSAGPGFQRPRARPPAGLVVEYPVPQSPQFRPTVTGGDAVVGARGAAGPRRARFCPRDAPCWRLADWQWQRCGFCCSGCFDRCGWLLVVRDLLRWTRAHGSSRQERSGVRAQYSLGI